MLWAVVVLDTTVTSTKTNWQRDFKVPENLFRFKRVSFSPRPDSRQKKRRYNFHHTEHELNSTDWTSSVPTSQQTCYFSIIIHLMEIYNFEPHGYQIINCKKCARVSGLMWGTKTIVFLEALRKTTTNLSRQWIFWTRFKPGTSQYDWDALTFGPAFNSLEVGGRCICVEKRKECGRNRSWRACFGEWQTQKEVIKITEYSGLDSTHELPEYRINMKHSRFR
jgi:hypothetical protein